MFGHVFFDDGGGESGVHCCQCGMRSKHLNELGEDETRKCFGLSSLLAGVDF